MSNWSNSSNSGKKEEARERQWQWFWYDSHVDLVTMPSLACLCLFLSLSLLSHFPGICLLYPRAELNIIEIIFYGCASSSCTWWCMIDDDYDSPSSDAPTSSSQVCSFAELIKTLLLIALKSDIENFPRRRCRYDLHMWHEKMSKNMHKYWKVKKRIGRLLWNVVKVISFWVLVNLSMKI